MHACVCACVRVCVVRMYFVCVCVYVRMCVCVTHMTHVCFVSLNLSRSEPVALVGSISVTQLTILSKSNTTARMAMKCAVLSRNLMGRVTCVEGMGTSEVW